MLAIVTLKDLVSMHLRTDDRTGWENTYKLPNKNTPLSAIFCSLGKCNSHIIGNGSASKIPSVTMLGIAWPRKKDWISMQCPVTGFLSQK